MARKKGDDINGWLIIDKPKGMGSTDVVNITRRMFNAKKSGHTGTLDPFATGVLPIAFGEATKLIPQVIDGVKEYEFVVCWGEETSTGDTEGEVIKTCPKIPTTQQIQEILPEFVGEVKQIPPIYSAIKIDGKRAYDLARAGKQIDMPERIVTICNLEFLGNENPNLSKFRVVCSKGTYVRTLGMDLAKRLGTVGYLKELRRTRCGIFSISDTILLESLKNIVHIEGLKENLLPLITSLRDIAVIAVSEVDAAKLKLGQSISPKNYEIFSLVDKEAVAMFEDKAVAIVRICERKISPVRVFNY